jgi:hypothetical protein
VEQEQEQSTKGPAYPSFGNSESPAAEVYGFYTHWDNFVTALTFSWSDKYNILEAPNRQVKRAMEKENSKFRDDTRKEYINKIRSLVAYVKKRDQRFATFEEEKLKKRKEEEAKREEQRRVDKERRKELREQWKSKLEDDTETRIEERKNAFLLADNESEDELYRGGSSRKGRKSGSGKSRRNFNGDEDEDEFVGGGATGAGFVHFDSEGVHHVAEGIEAMAVAGEPDVESKSVVEPGVTVDQIAIGERENDAEGAMQDDEGLGEETEEIDEELVLFHCEICNKNFKTEAQLTQHVASKVHRAKVKELTKSSSSKKSKKTS